MEADDFVPAGMLGWSPPATEVFDGSDGMAPLHWSLSLARAAVDACIIYEGSRFELFRGQIIQTAERLSPRYYYTAQCAADALIAIFGDKITHGRGVLPISDDTEVEPQLLVTRHSYEAYPSRHPSPEETLLVGEIAEGKTQIFLLGRKASLYASVGIPEYWVLLPKEKVVLVHREPNGDGYALVTPYTRGDAISPIAAPELAIRVNDLFEARHD